MESELRLPCVYLFFKRAVRRKTLPLGFEDLPIGCEDSDGPSKSKLARPPAEEQSQQQTPESEEISLMPINRRRRGNWFGYNPEQGIHYYPKINNDKTITNTIQPGR